MKSNHNYDNIDELVQLKTLYQLIVLSKPLEKAYRQIKEYDYYINLMTGDRISDSRDLEERLFCHEKRNSDNR